jgi:hypothetical protein
MECDRSPGKVGEDPYYLVLSDAQPLHVPLFRTKTVHTLRLKIRRSVGDRAE